MKQAVVLQVFVIAVLGSASLSASAGPAQAQGAAGEVTDRTETTGALSPDEQYRENEAANRERYLAALGVAGAAVLLLTVILLQVVILRRLSGEKRAVRKEGGRREKSGFSALRELAVALNNNAVDTHEMIEQLNLDLEDFGVEKWRVEKMLEKRFADLALGVVLVIDHLRLEKAEDEAAARLCDKLERVLADAGVREIPAAAGDPFDGERHQAVETRADGAPGIVTVLRPGFEMVDTDKGKPSRVLRRTETVVGGGPGGKG